MLGSDLAPLKHLPINPKPLLNRIIVYFYNTTHPPYVDKYMFNFITLNHILI